MISIARNCSDSVKACGSSLRKPPSSVPAALRAGRFESGEQQAFFLGLPYGRCEADALAKVASWSEEFGRGEIRLSPFKALVIPFMSADGCADLAPLAQAEGFIVDDNDPRLSISACVGMEGCAHGSTPTHADADRIAAASRWLQPGSSVHVSGCAKGCAHPAAADLTLVGNSGTYEVVLGGTARDKPVARVGIDTIVERLATTSSRIDLMHAFRDIRVMSISFDYVREGAEIYRRSFAMIRREADLGRFSPTEERLVVRMIHACGMTDLPRDVELSPDFADTAIAALRNGAPILCDSKMVANGITRARLPAANEVICTLDDPRVPAFASELNTTRSAAAMELWRDKLAGALVVFGNAPTALFRLLEMMTEGAPRPAAVIGIPVGFVGAVEFEAGAGRAARFAVRGGAWQTRRLRDGSRRRQRTGERERMTGNASKDRPALRRRPRSRRSRLHDGSRAQDSPERGPARPFQPQGQARQRPDDRGCGRGARSRARNCAGLSGYDRDRRARPGLWRRPSRRSTRKPRRALPAELEAGRSLAVLCEGDPFFYGSFMHLWRRLAPRFPTEVVPGVTGMSGSWTRAGVPITWGDDVLTVCPATLDHDALVARFRATDAAVVMKLGRHLPKVREALKEAGLHDRAIYVERGTMPDEFICPLPEKTDDAAPYFALILVPGQGRRL